jgi:hypothetical protein
MDIVKRNLSSDNIMTADEINKIFDAAYTMAGHGLGHETNNWLSKKLDTYNSNQEREIEEASKEERWGDFTSLLLFSAIHKSMIAPFASGAAKWTVLALEYGVPGVSQISNQFVPNRGKKVDFTSEKGLKDLKKSLVAESRIKQSTYRGYVAVLTTMISFGLKYLTLGGDDDDDGEEDTFYDKLGYYLNLDENKHLKPYFDKLAPISMLILMNIQLGRENEIVKVLNEKLNMSPDYFNRVMQLIKSVADNQEGTTTGAATKIIASPFNLPVPYKPFQDLINLGRGFNGYEPIKTTYKSRGAVEGLYEGGGLEWLYLMTKYKAGFKKDIPIEEEYEEENSKSVIVPEETEETE